MNSYHFSPTRPWGLYTRDSNTALPLKSLASNVKIVNNLAWVVHTQVFLNNTSSSNFAFFSFSLDSNVCLGSSSFRLDGLSPQEIKEDNIRFSLREQDRITQLVSHNDVEYDTIHLDINESIPPKSIISITYSYIQKLHKGHSSSWHFSLFSAIIQNSRKNFSHLVKTEAPIPTDYPLLVCREEARRAFWSCQVKIESHGAIRHIESSSHKIIIAYTNNNQSCIITLNQEESGATPSKDLELVFQYKNNDEAGYLLSYLDDEYVAMINLSPAMASKSNIHDNGILENKSLTFQNMVKREYVFLIDRSHSMKGDKMLIARNSLKCLLTALPTNSLFNIVSFGADHTSFYISSVSNSQDLIQESVSRIEKFEADMGDKKVYRPLKHILEQPFQEGYQRIIFLLSDGEIANTQQICQLINANNNKIRVFALGICTSGPHDFINKCAFYGKGKYEYVAEHSEVDGKAINLLNSSLAPYCSNISVSADGSNDLVKVISPNPSNIPFLLDGQTVTFFLILKKEAFLSKQTLTVAIRLRDSRIQDYRTVEIIINKMKILEEQFLHKLAIFDIVKRIQHTKTGKTLNSILRNESNKDLKDYMVKLAAKHGLHFSRLQDSSRNKTEETTNTKTEKASVYPKKTNEDPKLKLESSDNLKRVTQQKLTLDFSNLKSYPRDIFTATSDDARFKARSSFLLSNPKVSNRKSFTNVLSDEVKKIVKEEMSARNKALRAAMALESKTKISNFENLQSESNTRKSSHSPEHKTSEELRTARIQRKSQDLSPKLLLAYKRDSFHATQKARTAQKQIDKPKIMEIIPDKVANSMLSSSLSLRSKRMAYGAYSFPHHLSNSGMESTDKSLSILTNSEINFIKSTLITPKYGSHSLCLTGSQKHMASSLLISAFPQMSIQQKSAREGSQLLYDKIFSSLSSRLETNTSYKSGYKFLSPATKSSSSPESERGRKADSLRFSVIMKQKFEGFWDPQDQELRQIVLKDNKLPPLPIEIKDVMPKLRGEIIWMTVLVLLWLEITCLKEKKAWKLVHQKGCEWLEERDLNYENMKGYRLLVKE